MKLDFLGDVFLDKTYSTSFELNNFIFNLEYPLSCNGFPARNKVNLGQNRSYIKETFGAFPVAVNLANNHIMDYGEEGYIETIKFLDRNNIKYFGAGNKDNNFNNPSLIKSNNKIIALCGYSCSTTHPVIGSQDCNGSALLDEHKVIEDIIQIRKKADYIVIQLHWGDEEVKYPKPSDVEKARRFIDAGADLIIGHHAHVVQSYEIYKDKKIYYGLGNFIFPNLDVPAYYDGKKFLKRYIKTQSTDNKISVVVNVDANFNVFHKTSIFDGSQVKLKNYLLPRWIPKSDRQYNIYYKLNKKLGTIKRFIEKPRIPSVSQLKIFFR